MESELDKVIWHLNHEQDQANKEIHQMNEKIKEIEEWHYMFNRALGYNPPEEGDLIVKMVDYLDTLLIALKERGDLVAYWKKKLNIEMAKSDLREELKDEEIARLREDLKLNAAMLARQCDLAREAEGEVMRLRNALEEVRLRSWEALK